jgi:hypothetical protein
MRTAQLRTLVDQNFPWLQNSVSSCGYYAGCDEMHQYVLVSSPVWGS